MTANLLKQTLGAEVASTSDAKYYKSSQNQMQSTNKGWYLELLENERVTSAAILRGLNVVSFTSFIPGVGECNDVGATWITALNMFDGSLLNSPYFDTNRDGKFDQLDVNASRFVVDSGVQPSQSTFTDEKGNTYSCGVGQSDKGMICQLLSSYLSADTRQGWTEVNLSNR